MARNDYLVRRQRDNRYYLYAFDAWTDDVGSLIGSAKGYDDKGSALHAAHRDAVRNDVGDAVVSYEEKDGSFHQMGNVGRASSHRYRGNAMRVARDDLWLCQDCMIVAVNDDPTGIEDEERVEEVYAGLHRLGPHLVPDFSEGEGEDEFSSRRCDSCGTRLAGARYRFAILEEDPMHPNSSEQYWVWALGRDKKPLATEGPWGPYDFQGARSYARISATKGTHDRAVSRGKDPLSASFEIVRIYAAGTGEHKYGVAQMIGAPMAANAHIAEITHAAIRYYSDSGQKQAVIEWIDSRGKHGRTTGDPSNGHMQALLSRAERENVPVRKENW